MLGWGFADLFYKKSNVDGDRYSHMKTAVWVGLMMGVFALLAWPVMNVMDKGLDALREGLRRFTRKIKAMRAEEA